MKTDPRTQSIEMISIDIERDEFSSYEALAQCGMDPRHAGYAISTPKVAALQFKVTPMPFISPKSSHCFSKTKEISPRKRSSFFGRHLSSFLGRYKGGRSFFYGY